MSIYIQDDKSHTVRHYNTKNKIEKAVETLLRSDEELVYSETHKGYEISLINNDEDDIDVLDKIRAEIEQMTPTYHNNDWSITDLVPISEVLKLIDKYKKESEE